MINNERYRFHISAGELERRWDLVRAAMAKEDVDALIVNSYDNMLGGYFRWFTDYMVADYPLTCLFYREKDMSVLGHGNPGAPFIPADYSHGVTYTVSTPNMPTLWYTDSYIPELVVKDLKDKGAKKVGIIAMATMPASMYKYLTENLDGVELVDFTDPVDYIKAVKSPEELDRLRQAVRIHDIACAAMPAFFRPGRYEYEITADLRKLCSDLDSECIVNIGLGTSPEFPPKLMVPMQGRRVQEGDNLFCLVEVSGPGGYYCEISRVWSLGQPSEAMLKASAAAVGAAAEVEKWLKPGSTGAQLLKANNDYLTARGYFPEGRLFGHGQGYDMVERPAFVNAETMPLAENMFVTAHPGASDGKALGISCNSYIITKDGFEKLTQTPDGIIIL